MTTSVTVRAHGDKAAEVSIDGGLVTTIKPGTERTFFPWGTQNLMVKEVIYPRVPDPSTIDLFLSGEAYP